MEENAKIFVRIEKSSYFCYHKTMLDFDGLTKHLKDSHGLNVDKNQETDLRNIGYYHGYKGYRFIRKSSNRIAFTSFSQVVTLNRFDMRLKTIIYPRLMFLENALKSRVIEVVLSDSGTENLSEIYKKSLTYYQEFKTKNPNQTQNDRSRYRQEFKKKKDLEMKISSALIRDYMQGRDIENHYFDNDRDVPLWAAFESLTLGEFGIFFSCTNMAIKKTVSEQLGLRKSLNADGGLLTDIIFCLKNLRNAIAHNGVIFDTRFATQKVEPRVKKLLETEMEIENIDFSFIVSYVALIVYLLKALKETKDCVSFINEYEKTIEMLSANFPQEVYFKIVGTQEKSVLEKMRAFVKRTS